LRDINGGGLLSRYNDSPSQLLTAVYPDYEWLLWKFERPPKNTRKDLNTIKQHVEWLGKKLGIKDYRDWYQIKENVLVLLIFSQLLKELPKIAHILPLVYPEHKWHFKTNSQNRKSQFLLKETLKVLFPNEGK
jgi:hypothetical protein